MTTNKTDVAIVRTVSGTVEFVGKDDNKPKVIKHSKYVSIAIQCAEKVSELSTMAERSVILMQETNVLVAKLIKDKQTVGRRNKCNLADAFYNTLIAVEIDKDGKAVLDANGNTRPIAGKKPLAVGTANNYLGVLVNAVKKQKVIEKWNQHRKTVGDGKKDTTKKDTTTKAKTLTAKEQDALNNESLAKLFWHLHNIGEGKLLRDLFAKWDDLVTSKKQPNHYACSVSFMEQEGYVATDATAGSNVVMFKKLD